MTTEFFRKFADMLTESTASTAPVDKKNHPLAVGDVISLGGSNIDRIESIIMVPAIVTRGRNGTFISMCKDATLIAQNPSEEELLQLRTDIMNSGLPTFSPTTPEHFRGGLERDSYGKRHGL